MPRDSQASTSSSGSARNVYVLCASLFVLFAGYNTSQELAPKLLGSDGKIVVVVFYTTATIAGPLPARVAAALGTRMALFLSGLTYAAYVASLAYLILPLTIALSVVLGVAAAVLFTVLPAEVNACVPEERRGWANSLTWARCAVPTAVLCGPCLLALSCTATLLAAASASAQCRATSSPSCY